MHSKTQTFYILRIKDFSTNYFARCETTVKIKRKIKVIKFAEMHKSNYGMTIPHCTVRKQI